MHSLTLNFNPCLFLLIQLSTLYVLSKENTIDLNFLRKYLRARSLGSARDLGFTFFLWFGLVWPYFRPPNSFGPPQGDGGSLPARRRSACSVRGGSAGSFLSGRTPLSAAASFRRACCSAAGGGSIFFFRARNRKGREHSRKRSQEPASEPGSSEPVTVACPMPH